MFNYFSDKDEWKLFFDGSNCMHRGVGIFLINPHVDVIPISYHLSFDYINNMAKYKAIILGRKAAILIKVKNNLWWFSIDGKISC